MKTIEQKFVCDGESYDLELTTKGIKIFMSENGGEILIADKDNNVFCQISADCAQNQAFMSVESIP